MHHLARLIPPALIAGAMTAGAFSSASLPAAAPAQSDRFQAGPWEDDYGYRQAVRSGNTLYISGCTGRGAMPEAIQRAYGNIGKTLAHYGLDFSHVVKETVFATDLDALKAARDVRKQFYGTGGYPASSWIGVSRLFQPDHTLEVEVVAVFPDPAGTGAPTAAGTVADVTALLREFLARVDDPAMHARFWADDVVYTSGKGEVRTKADILKNVSAPPAADAPAAKPTYDAEEMRVRAYGTTAALNFRLVAHNPDGTTLHYRNSGAFLHRNGQWQAVTWQATREPDAK